MSNIEGEAKDCLAAVQAIFDEAAPGAVCQLKDYNFRIGCGNMDNWGNIQEVVFLRSGLTTEAMLHQAASLAIKVKTGGSTAG